MNPAAEASQLESNVTIVVSKSKLHASNYLILVCIELNFCFIPFSVSYSHSNGVNTKEI